MTERVGACSHPSSTLLMDVAFMLFAAHRRSPSGKAIHQRNKGGSRESNRQLSVFQRYVSVTVAIFIATVALVQLHATVIRMLLPEMFEMHRHYANAVVASILSVSLCVLVLVARFIVREKLFCFALAAAALGTAIAGVILGISAEWDPTKAAAAVGLIVAGILSAMAIIAFLGFMHHTPHWEELRPEL